MWFKFVAIAALVFHHADAVNAVDYWLRGSAYKMLHKPLQPINKEWKTNAGQHGSVLLGNVVAAQASPKSEKHQVPTGPPEDFTLLRHKAEGLKADHPVNREYK
jgi:hypothetical protein